MPRDERYVPIEDHGIIGDLETIALVALDGTIDFMCVPRFDSPSVFASLLDPDRGGSFRVQPRLGEPRHKQFYLPDSNVLMTRSLSPDGVAEITDWMPIAGGSGTRRLVRQVRAVRQPVRFTLRCAPRFGYGAAEHRVERRGDAVVFVPSDHGPAGPAFLALRGTVPMEVEGGDAVADFEVRPGETATFLLEASEGAGLQEIDPAGYAARTFTETADFWRGWIGRSSYRGRWRDEVHRSALVLRLLFSDRHGSLVAAPTFGLPEAPGGARNWDYRYTWVRDAAFTLYALIRLGLTEETGRFIHWIAARCEEDPHLPLQPLYALDGSADVPETELAHLAGYRGSRPVRIGNAAARQLQLDVFGALLDAVYLYDKYAEPMAYDLWGTLTRLVDWVCENWRTPDHGLWEIRQLERPYLSSRVLCWVAVDRALRIGRHRSLPMPEARWTAARDDLYRSVFEEFWNPRREAFMQYPGAPGLDASCLLMPLLRFIAPTDPRWLTTMREVRRELVDDSLVRRYDVRAGRTDGFEDEEGTFSICSFWYAECLSRAGDLHGGRFVFEKILGYANHLGLFSEELGPSGEHLGNFPQAFTHLALVSAAYDLDRRLDRAGWGA
jgi:GH15 family glucan-1,4-alpha-glucosidase